MAPDLPPVPALVVGVLALGGAFVALLGATGLLRMRTFYDRVHPPTLATSMGLAALALASIVTSSVLGSRTVIHEILLLFFVVLTMPVSMMLLARAAIFRDRVEAYDKSMAAEARAAAEEEAAALAAAQEEAAALARRDLDTGGDDDAVYG
jgi:multicomponent K+:H+ antiporter subunit G